MTDNLEPTPMSDFAVKRIERIWDLDEAVRQIVRMRVSPDEKINKKNLTAAIEIARGCLGG